MRGTLNFLLENSLFLIFGTASALLLANFDFELYSALIHGRLLGGHGEHEFNLHFLINDVFMCVFFAMAAKEIWEAFLPGGALSSLRTAMTPLFATAGGVLGPALLFLGGTQFFGRPDLERGWAVPTATDIAFSYLVARIVFGARHPAIPFLLLLAIADDAVGLLILALFYPQAEVSLGTLGLCLGGALAFNAALRYFKVSNFWAYLVVAGPLSWYGFFEGGVHPALALVPIIPTLPHAKHDEGLFEETEGISTAADDALTAFARWWKKPVEVILMFFGFCNAGVLLGNVGLPTALVATALLFGKPLGISLFTFIAIKVLRFQMPTGMTMKDVFVLGSMAGIGFTVALFVSEVAFGGAGPSASLDAAKMGALLSFFAGVVSWILSKLLHIRRIT